jgi:hypothetical protein
MVAWLGANQSFRRDANQSRDREEAARRERSASRRG